ncbi:MAG: glutaredoxin family protein [Methylohalobius crimeensis]
MNRRWILYGTAACHLCEQARDLLVLAGVESAWIDIALDDTLVERLGDKIPVVGCRVTGRELGWPFDLQQLQRFLQMCEED